MPFKQIEAEYYMVDSLPPKYTAITDDRWHDRWNGYSGYFEITIKLVSESDNSSFKFISPLHTGTGDLELANNSGYFQPFARVDNKLIISGSGIKGVVRSYAEALSNSCEGNQCSGKRLCPACLLFGFVSKGFSYKGRFSFSDVFFSDDVKTQIIEVPLRWGGRNKAGRRFYWHCDYRAYTSIEKVEKEKIEVVMPPASIITRLYFENAGKEELGLLLLAMGVAPARQFPLKMGGGKNRGLGSVWFELTGQYIQSNSDHSFLSYDVLQQEINHEFVASSIEEYYRKLADKEKEKINCNLKAFSLENAYRTQEKAKEEFEQQIERNRANY
jgi:CRISPR/Cas system CSM-associated protein Csm3 (group 7 of RAMP superfamily)